MEVSLLSIIMHKNLWNLLLLLEMPRTGGFKVTTSNWSRLKSTKRTLTLQELQTPEVRPVTVAQRKKKKKVTHSCKTTEKKVPLREFSVRVGRKGNSMKFLNTAQISATIGK